MQMNIGGKCLRQELKGLLRKEVTLTLAAMAAAVICEEELSSVEATPLSFFSSSSSSHCTPLSSVCLWGLVVGGGERGGGGEGRSSSSSCTSFTFTMASRKRSMAWGRAGSINWKHSYAEWEEKPLSKVTCTWDLDASFHLIVNTTYHVLCKCSYKINKLRNRSGDYSVNVCLSSCKYSKLHNRAIAVKLILKTRVTFLRICNIENSSQKLAECYKNAEEKH